MPMYMYGRYLYLLWKRTHDELMMTVAVALRNFQTRSPASSTMYYSHHQPQLGRHGPARSSSFIRGKLQVAAVRARSCRPGATPRAVLVAARTSATRHIYGHRSRAQSDNAASIGVS